MTVRGNGEAPRAMSEARWAQRGDVLAEGMFLSSDPHQLESGGAVSFQWGPGRSPQRLGDLDVLVLQGRSWSQFC